MSESESNAEVRDALEQFKDIIRHLSDKDKELFMREITGNAFIYIAALKDASGATDEQMMLEIMRLYDVAKQIVKKIKEANILDKQ
jgi:hypothetical protein